MAFEDSDRRRTTLLGILTLLALPALFFFARADDTSADSAVDIEIGVDGNPIPLENNSPSRPPLMITDAEPTFLDGPAADPNRGVAEIAVPQRPAVEPIQLSASFRSTVAGIRSCLVRELRSGLTVTITNLDNSRSITCVTSIAPFTQNDDIVLHPDTFSLLADLTEAPISVEVTR